jgi:hypothetical protein
MFRVAQADGQLLRATTFSASFQFAISETVGYVGDVTVAENKFLKEAVKQGLRMQHRFLAEPVLARTGKGYLKSEGVTTLQRIKASLKKPKPGGRHVPPA